MKLSKYPSVEIYGATKHVIVELISTKNEYHLLVGLEEEEKVVMHEAKGKKAPKKRASKHGQKGGGGWEKVSSSKFDDVFDVKYDVP